MLQGYSFQVCCPGILDLVKVIRESEGEKYTTIAQVIESVTHSYIANKETSILDPSVDWPAGGGHETEPPRRRIRKVLAIKTSNESNRPSLSLFECRKV